MQTGRAAYDEKTFGMQLRALEQVKGVATAILPLFGGKVLKDQAKCGSPILGARGFRDVHLPHLQGSGEAHAL
jgi:hypothetical protein